MKALIPITREMNEFYRRMSQASQSYQQAIVFVAAEKMAAELNHPDRTADQAPSPKKSPLGWVEKVMQGLAGRFAPNTTSSAGNHTKKPVPPSQVVIDVSTSPGVYDQEDE